MTDTTVSNSQASSNPDIEVRTSTTAGGKEIQHVRLDLGVGSAEDQAEGALPVSSIFAAINHGSKSFATAGVAEALGASTDTAQIDIIANSANTGIIWIGGSGVSSGNGRPLVAGQMYSVSVSNLATVFGVSTVDGEGVSFNRFV